MILGGVRIRTFLSEFVYMLCDVTLGVQCVGSAKYFEIYLFFVNFAFKDINN